MHDKFKAKYQLHEGEEWGEVTTGLFGTIQDAIDHMSNKGYFAICVERVTFIEGVRSNEMTNEPTLKTYAGEFLVNAVLVISLAIIIVNLIQWYNLSFRIVGY